MAILHYEPFIEKLVPPPSGAGPIWQPSAILDANDLYPGAPILAYPDGSTKIGASCHLDVPAFYPSGGTGMTVLVFLRWKVNATSGNVVWDLDYTAIAAGESGDPSAHQRSVTVTTAAPGTARLYVDSTLTMTAADLALADTLHLLLSRDLADSADTCAATVELVRAVFVIQDT